MPVAFWRSNNGREPVREFLQTLKKDERRTIGNDLRQLQFGWPIGMPLVRKLEGQLWELRTTLSSSREVRIVFLADREVLVLLHAFIKKSQKTPKKELDVARQRLKGISE